MYPITLNQYFGKTPSPLFDSNGLKRNSPSWKLNYKNQNKSEFSRHKSALKKIFQKMVI